MELANRLLNQTSMEERVALKNRLLESMTPQVLQDLQMRGQDPLIMYFRQQALQRLRNDKQLRIQQAQQQLAMSQQAQGLPNGAPMQQQRSMNPSPLNGQSQLAAGMGTNSDFNFLNNMDNLAAQQKQAAMAAEAGQVVVPANAAQRNGTPQPGAMSGQQLNMGMNGQQGVPNQMNAAQQQQIRNNQQLQQQQRLAQQQTHQAQIQARMNAQKMGLQGQPGGMGNGPMPPQQSPALPTLNAPLRTPSQMGHQDSPQVNPNSHFGQQLDPRFAQANNRGLMGPGAGMNAGFNPQQLMASMSREQQQKVGQLPPDKLQEVLMKLNEQRAMNSANPQRPQMQQGNNQIQPGMQVPQGNQFGMPGQRPAQLNGSNMTPQQQIALQEQIARLQQNPQQRQPLPPHMEQNIVRTMDGVDFPSNLHNHGSFPQGVPPEIKKWGPLKVWVQQNQNSIAPEVPETLRQLQRIHWQAMVRGRNSTVQAGQAGGMQPGIQGGQAGMPGMPMSAPVAPMTQNAMQQPPGMNMAGLGQIRQPTQQEIQNARQHPSGRMAAATDDQIRQFLMQQQRHRQQMMQNMQMQNQMPQLNMQQGRSGQQPQMANARPAVQPPAQPNQPKQMPPNVNTPNAANNNLQNANRNARPAANSTQNGPQNSSPAQPSKSLKRSQSDDVIEVPNPNISQPSRQPVQQAHAAQQNQQTLQNQAGNAQQNQGQKPVVPPGRPSLNLTPQQVAALDPEARKKHDLGVRLARAEQKIKAFASDEQEKSDNTQFVPVPMNADTKAS
ncbi:hypothetical protein M7I_6080 [Glarea lozoyensis 74030]|nr:hypothetical protein M7I_6080 [Glarea lozoyensis 74030]